MPKCLECGLGFRRVTNTHLARHDMTMQDYARKYPDAAFDDPDLAVRRVDHLRARTYEEVYGSTRARELKCTRRRDAIRQFKDPKQRKLRVRALKGKVYSSATRKRVSQARKLWWSKIPTERRRELLRKFICSPRGIETSYLEDLAAKILRRASIVYRRQKRFGSYRADFYLPQYHMIVECDGEYWHLPKKAQIRDAVRDDYFISVEGCLVLRLTGTLIHKASKNKKAEHQLIGDILQCVIDASSEAVKLS